LKNIWNFVYDFNFFLFLKNIFKFLMTWHVTSASRGQSCTVSNCHVAITMSYQQKSGVKDFFK